MDGITITSYSLSTSLTPVGKSISKSIKDSFIESLNDQVERSILGKSSFGDLTSCQLIPNEKDGSTVESVLTTQAIMDLMQKYKLWSKNTDHPFTTEKFYISVEPKVNVPTWSPSYNLTMTYYFAPTTITA